MIEIEELELRYGEGDFRLRIRELTVERGAKVAVVGPSGAGKTTFLHLVAGISLPRAGRVVTGGVELTGLDEAERRAFRIRNIGLVFQEFELLEYLNVLDNLVDHAEESGATLVLVTHDRDLLGRFERVIDFREFHGAAA